MSCVRLEFGTAFDHAASWLAGVEPPLLAVVSLPEFVDLTIARASGPLTFVCENDATHAYARRQLGQGGMPHELAQQSAVLPMLGHLALSTSYGGVLWASPQQRTWRATLHGLRPLLTRGARLCILTGTSWGELVRPLRVKVQPGEPAGLARRVRAEVAADGWPITRSHAVGGLAGVGWAIAGRVAAGIGRLDLADRAEQAHHRAVDTPVGASYELLLVGKSP
jgi:hypothetical protein